MNTLRVLFVDNNPGQSQHIASVLSDANHNVLPAKGLEEASEAVCAQKFDAVLLGAPLPAEGLAEFTALLRSLEKAQRAGVRTPVLSFSPHCPDASCPPLAGEADIDGYLPEHFDPSLLADAVNRLSRVGYPGEPGRAARAPELPIFEPEKFQAQVCNDRDLLIEIIDLFLTESVDQVAEMWEALKAGDYHRLCRVSHTIKGSLGSLHAAMARSHAQDLETAAKEFEEQVCRFSLAALEQDLDNLKPRLIALREFACSH